jgi:hypothetical protein
VNRHWAFFDPVTGLFAGRTYGGSSVEGLKNNTPEGCAAIEGMYDHLAQRVDIITGEVVDYQPPQPSADHEWNADTKRWQLTAAAQDVINADAIARAQLEAIDRQSIRALREAALGKPEAVALLATLDAQATPLRADVIVETPVLEVTPG